MKNILLALTLIGLCLVSCEKIDSQSNLPVENNITESDLTIEGKTYEAEFIINHLQISTGLERGEIIVDKENESFSIKGYDEIYKLKDFLNLNKLEN